MGREVADLQVSLFGFAYDGDRVSSITTAWNVVNARPGTFTVTFQHPWLCPGPRAGMLSVFSDHVVPPDCRG